MSEHLALEFRVLELEKKFEALLTLLEQQAQTLRTVAGMLDGVGRDVWQKR